MADVLISMTTAVVMLDPSDRRKYIGTYEGLSP
jgi:hypothetical protein